MLTWTVVVWRRGEWRRLHKTYYKVFANAVKKAVALQKLYPLEMVRARQHPPAVVKDNKHVIKGTGKQAPVYGAMRTPPTFAALLHLDLRRARCEVMVGDMLPSDIHAFTGGGIEEYEESAQWSGDGFMVTWNADNTGYSSYTEDQYGRRRSLDATFKVQNGRRRIS